MEENAISFLRSAIERRAQIKFTMAGLAVSICPYVVYEAIGDRLTVAGLSDAGFPLHVPVAQIQDLATTGYFFEPEAAFNLDDPRYRNAIAIIKLG